MQRWLEINKYMHGWMVRSDIDIDKLFNFTFF